MKAEHKTIIPEEIKRILKKKYNVTSTRNVNRLPDSKTHLYEPDVIVWDRNEEVIRKIIEIECDPVRKSIVGAAILADYCLKFRKQLVKPDFYFIVYGENGIKQLKDFQARIKVIKAYIKYIQEPIVGGTKKIYGLLDDD